MIVCGFWIQLHARLYCCFYGSFPMYISFGAGMGEDLTHPGAEECVILIQDPPRAPPLRLQWDQPLIAYSGAILRTD
ncbi:hypothetical protein SAMN05216411_104122 [Nitrosospira multiformis]|nr:hypothetical protein SAMN05216411_104122 [Nitrosospira multiformis]